MLSWGPRFFSWVFMQVIFCAKSPEQLVFIILPSWAYKFPGAWLGDMGYYPSHTTQLKFSSPPRSITSSRPQLASFKVKYTCNLPDKLVAHSCPQPLAMPRCPTLSHLLRTQVPALGAHSWQRAAKCSVKCSVCSETSRNKSFFLLSKSTQHGLCARHIKYISYNCNSTAL